ncbi:unnamed protein product [Amaranthus hypochondriacus]
MDRSWMYGKRDSIAFVNGVKEFCHCALQHQQESKNDDFYCPCRDCQNIDIVNNIKTLRDHIMTRGFRKQYYVWLWHGESPELCRYDVGQAVEVECSSRINDNYIERGNEEEEEEEEETRVEIDKGDEEGEDKGDGEGSDDDVAGDHINYDDNEEEEEEEVIHENDDDDNNLDEILEGVQDDLSERPRLFKSDEFVSYGSFDDEDEDDPV